MDVAPDSKEEMLGHVDSDWLSCAEHGFEFAVRGGFPPRSPGRLPWRLSGEHTALPSKRMGNPFLAFARLVLPDAPSETPGGRTSLSSRDHIGLADRQSQPIFSRALPRIGRCRAPLHRHQSGCG